MPKLSNAQLVVLSTACQRPDGYVFPITLKLKGNAIGNVLKSLLAKGFLEEIRGRADDTIWRYDDGMPLTLKAARAAYDALGIEPADTPADTPAGANPSAAGRHEATSGIDEANGSEPAPLAPVAPRVANSREGSKQARLIVMLKQPAGATIEEIVAAFDWQAHTVRGAIAGALKKKLGLAVTSEKIEGRGRVYRLEA